MTLPNFDDGQGADQTAALIARRQRLLGPAYRLFYDSPVHLVRGEGVWLYDAQGKPYLDAYNNVVPLGHCHPAVVDAIARQAAILNTHTRYVHETVLDYAEALLATFPAGPGQVMFTCTGSEANDLALRIAQAHTGATGLIVTRFAYHGVTLSIAQASPSLGRYVTLGPTVRTVTPPDTYRQGATALARRWRMRCKRPLPTWAGKACGQRRCWSTRSFPVMASRPRQRDS